MGADLVEVALDDGTGVEAGGHVASYALPMDVPSELVGRPAGLLGQLTSAELVVLGPAGGTR